MALVIFLPRLENLPQNLAFKPHFEALPKSGTGCFEALPRSGTGYFYPRLAPLRIWYIIKATKRGLLKKKLRYSIRVRLCPSIRGALSKGETTVAVINTFKFELL